MKKVLLVSGSLPPIRCGVGYYTRRLIGKLHGREIDLSVLSTEDVADVDVPLLPVPDWKISSLPKMLAQIKEAEPAIIHIQYPAVGYRRNLGINFLPYLLRVFKPRLKVLVTLHEYSGSRFLGRARDFVTVLPAHKIIVSNEADRLALPGFLRNKSRLIPIASNLEKVPKDPAVYEKVMKACRLDPKKPTLQFFGFANPKKGLDIVLDAMRQPYLKDWQLLLLSSLDKAGAYQNNLLAGIDDINKDGRRIAAAGFLPDEQVSAVMRQGRYFMLAQHTPLTAKSSTAIAAVQHGLVLVSHGGPAAKLSKPFAHLENCYLLGELSPENIAEAVRFLEALPADRDKIRRGAEVLEKYFSWDSIVREHLKLYGEF